MLVTFQAGDAGAWTVDRIDAVVGRGLPPARRLDILEDRQGKTASEAASGWALRGFTSNERYVERQERAVLTALQPPLGRPEATHAALIPVRKSDAWWDLTQDDRRSILEDRSRHIAIGLEYLPAVARRLHHSRDLGEAFDFLTWFEYAPEASDSFEELVRRLRSTDEWSFVEREVDVRLTRSPA